MSKSTQELDKVLDRHLSSFNGKFAEHVDAQDKRATVSNERMKLLEVRAHEADIAFLTIKGTLDRLNDHITFIKSDKKQNDITKSRLVNVGFVVLGVIVAYVVNYLIAQK